ncbi:MAG: hypothetical protein O7G88_05945 [bacterium]|nr:hypothetical protein [bacterium]
MKLPYIDFGVYLISAWKKIGVEAEHRLLESATWSKSRRTRDFALMVDPYNSAGAGDPDEIMERNTSGSTQNWGRFSDPVVDELFDKQKVELDVSKRQRLVWDLQKEVLKKAHWIPGLWWTRIEVRSSRIKNYEPHHSHWMNRRLEDVWMAKK